MHTKLLRINMITVPFIDFFVKSGRIKKIAERRCHILKVYNPFARKYPEKYFSARKRSKNIFPSISLTAGVI